MATKSFTAAMREHFGKDKPAMEFIKEIKSLTDDDKLELFALLQESGIDCEKPTLKA